MNLPFFKFVGRSTRLFFLHAQPVYFAVYSIYKRRSDRRKIEIIRSFVKPGDCVVDIGAHIGFYTRLFSVLVGPEGCVFAFEPSSENFHLLQRNTNKLTNVKILEAAVGQNPGQQRLFISPDLNVDHRMFPVAGVPRDSVRVDVVSLDNFFKAHTYSISFIKMDVQGFEFDALAGMRQILYRYRPRIVSELWPWGLSKAGSSTKKMLGLLRDIKYEIFLVDESTGELRPLVESRLQMAEDIYYDIFCQTR